MYLSYIIFAASVVLTSPVATKSAYIRSGGTNPFSDKALLRGAKVINAADTDRLDADALATGFEAIAVGYSLRFPKDLENIERQFEVYDALYAWCRLDVARNQV